MSGGDGDNLGRKLQSRLHLVHALAAERVVEVEVLLVVVGKLQGVELVEGTGALERHVVDDKHRPGVRQLAVVLVRGESGATDVCQSLAMYTRSLSPYGVWSSPPARARQPRWPPGRAWRCGSWGRVPVTRVDVIGDGVVALVVDEDGVHAVLVHVEVPTSLGYHHVE